MSHGDSRCHHCGQVLPEAKSHAVTVWVERNEGGTRPMTSEPMTKRQAKSEWAQLKAVGYNVSMHRAGKVTR